ncbi:MAG: polyphosphate kinase 1 [Thermostichales cyanobacterium DRC_bins_46]
MTAPVQAGFAPPEDYLNREVSWIRFNERVLQEALDERNPLLERLKFLAIFETNLDEFFMVRVAVIRRQMVTGVSALTPDGLTPTQQLHLIREALQPLVAEHHRCFEAILRPQLLQKAGIHLAAYSELSPEQRQELHLYFQEQLYPVLTPLAIDPGHPFPYISGLSLSLMVIVGDPETQEKSFARVKVPTGVLSRFVPLADGTTYVPLEEVIAHNLQALFVGMEIQGAYLFRVTRDADLEIQEDEADDLLAAIEQELRKRRFGSVVRLEVSADTPEWVVEFLQEQLEVETQQIYVIEGMMNLGDLMYFMRLDRPDLKDPPWVIPTHPRLRPTQVNTEVADVFAVIREKDLLLHHPYDSFNTSVLALMQQAARDPHVLSIKQTLYRTSGDSEVVQALIEAVERGKQVAVVVELKARFDEENNIWWAKKLEEAGVHVTYGIPGLKIHSKILAVVRREGNQLRRYVHIGTGNYNPKTAKIYTDLGLLTCHPVLAGDVSDVFNYLTGYSRQKRFQALLVSPMTMRSQMNALIDREIQSQGRIIAKMNSLVDPQIIAKLYEASRAGVEIDLIVRGMCCLKPGVKGLSDRIRVISIVGRFLEHSRIFYFENQGQPEVYIGSADWMTRNLDRRVEVVTPIWDGDLRQDLKGLLDLMLADNRQAWELDGQGIYHRRYPKPGEPERATHELLMQQARRHA